MMKLSYPECSSPCVGGPLLSLMSQHCHPSTCASLSDPILASLLCPGAVLFIGTSKTASVSAHSDRRGHTHKVTHGDRHTHLRNFNWSIKAYLSHFWSTTRLQMRPSLHVDVRKKRGEQTEGRECNIILQCNCVKEMSSSIREESVLFSLSLCQAASWRVSDSSYFRLLVAMMKTLCKIPKPHTEVDQLRARRLYCNRNAIMSVDANATVMSLDSLCAQCAVMRHADHYWTTLYEKRMWSPHCHVCSHLMGRILTHFGKRGC